MSATPRLSCLCEICNRSVKMLTWVLQLLLFCFEDDGHQRQSVRYGSIYANAIQQKGPLPKSILLYTLFLRLSQFYTIRTWSGTASLKECHTLNCWLYNQPLHWKCLWVQLFFLSIHLQKCLMLLFVDMFKLLRVILDFSMEVVWPYRKTQFRKALRFILVLESHNSQYT